jgi:GNAT superfamily N-acetyltransferase
MLPVYNIGLLSFPCTDLDDLRSRIEPLRAFAAERGKPWMFTPADAWLPDGGGNLLESLGFMETMRLTGMVATELTPPSRQVTADIRQLSGSEGAVVMGRLNCAAYGMPLEWADETDWADFFGPDVFTYAMQEDGADVSTATVFVIEDCLNVVAVATLSEFQRKGYAEAVMRHALQQASRATGLTRTVLHASDVGRPLYERMGYRAVAGFGAWTPTHG